jgi:hypothetical protein
MKRNLKSRTVKLEEKIQPQKKYAPIRFLDEEWDQLTELEQAEIEHKHGLVIIRKIVHAKDGR